MTTTLVQQVNGTSTLDYGWSTINVTTTGGNGLVLLAGWDLTLTATDAPVPAVYVTDSACNRWYHAATTSSGVTGSRCSAWICPNARSISWLSVSLTIFGSSLAYTLLELSGMPQYYSLDVIDASAVTSGSSLALAPGSTAQADVGFSVFTTGASGLAPSTPSGWTALTTVTAGAGGAAPVQIFPYWRTLTSATSANTTYTVANSVPLAGITFAVNAAPSAPVMSNANFPNLLVEAAFGATPGDPSQAPPVDGGGPGLGWTDITSFVIGREDGPFISPTAGREYELATPEAGEMDVWLNNWAGDFVPGNTASPFYPGVMVNTPIRASALWGGQWYWAGSGWTERWPQTWPDIPQFGIVPVKVTDAMAVLNSATMVSALAGEMLIDAPYVFIPCSEQYLSFSNGLSFPTSTSSSGALGSYSTADAQGLLAANISRLNQRAGMYVDGTAATADTGQSTNLLGEENTGFGTSSISADPLVAEVSGAGMIYTDPNLPSPVEGNGVTVEFWVVIPATVPDALQQPVVFTAYGTPSSYQSVKGSLTILVNNATGSNTINVIYADGSFTSAVFTASAQPQQIAVALTAASSQIYVNGALVATASLTASQTGDWGGFSLGNPNYAFEAGAISVGNFTAFDCAIYPYVLPPQRINAHYTTGITGQENVPAPTRIAQIASWANLGLPRGGLTSFGTPAVAGDNVTMGPAYGLSGSSAADAINQVALNDAGLVTAAQSGSLVYWPRWALFNQSPAVTFGDSPVVDSGEVPYLQAQSWDFDSTYLYNETQVTQQTGPNTGITATATDTTSVSEYFTRSALQQTIQTTSNEDAFDRTNWNIAGYSQPALRVKSVTIDAASNPSVAFPAVLQLQQGQVATVTRRPVGGVVISETCIIQKIQHQIGPTSWQTSLELSPYQLSANVLTLDVSGFNVLGANNLA